LGGDAVVRGQTIRSMRKSTKKEWVSTRGEGGDGKKGDENKPATGRKKKQGEQRLSLRNGRKTRGGRRTGSCGGGGFPTREGRSRNKKISYGRGRA